MTEVGHAIVKLNGHTQPESTERSLRQVCAERHELVTSFLEEQVETELLKKVQNQTRISLAVLQEALKTNEWVCFSEIPICACADFI